MSRDTRKLNQDNAGEPASREITAIDMGLPRPWRIALRILQCENRVIFDMSGPMVIGRRTPDGTATPDIDLGPYEAEKMGVSRQHLTLKLDGNRIIAVDNDSANGTLLNRDRMEPNESYPIRDGDEITLGLMALKVELLMDPFH